jgi:membrane-associated protein
MGSSIATGRKTVFVARFITGLRVVGAILAGASGLRLARRSCSTTPPAPWSGAPAVAAAGYALANSWDTLERWIGRTGLVALVLVIIVALIARWRQHDSK